MKYVHGIHRLGHGSPVVTSLTILYPEESKGAFYSYHHESMSLFGENPVEPNLQALGLILGSKREEDYMYRVVSRLLTMSGISNL